MLPFPQLVEVRGFIARILFQMKTLTRMRNIIDVLTAGPEGSKTRFCGFHRGWLSAALVAGLTAAGPAPRALAQNQTGAAAAPSNNRFLFIVDTSSGMKKQGDKERETVESILRSGFNGQLHTGDTIGLWTFNEDVYTGRLGLQQWTPGDSDEIVLRTTEFLRRQPFERKSRLDVAMSAVNKIINVSDVITVVIVSDGKNSITGTPFDNDINTLYAQNLKDTKKNPEPMVTVLQGKGGAFTKQYSVAELPWPVVIPALPISLKLAKAPGDKPATVAATTPAPAPKAPAPPAAKGPSLVLVGPQPPEFPMPVQTPAPAVTITPPPAPSVPTVQQVASTPQAPEVTPASPGQVTAPVPAEVQSARLRPPVDSATYVGPRQGYMPPPPAASQPPIAPVPTPAVPTPAAPTPAVTAPVVAHNPAPAPVPAPTPAPVMAVAVTQPAPQPAAPTPAVADSTVEHAKPAVPAPVRPIVAAQSGWMARSFGALTGTSWMIGGACVLVLGVTLMALFSRRSNSSSGRISLISQTMNK